MLKDENVKVVGILTAQYLLEQFRILYEHDSCTTYVRSLFTYIIYYIEVYYRA